MPKIRGDFRIGNGICFNCWFTTLLPYLKYVKSSEELLYHGYTCGGIFTGDFYEWHMVGRFSL
ncbi:MAG: hypothetical protein ACTS73_02080 [Arsenophonus sp. NEOnobi-MAG3]